MCCIVRGQTRGRKGVLTFALPMMTVMIMMMMFLRTIVLMKVMIISQASV